MSAGSNNIVVTITDQVDASIAPKIREIAAAARDANTYLVTLQTAVAGLSAGSSKLSSALASVTPNVASATAGTSRLEGAIAQLAGRVAGAEAGFGMLGGALARVGVAAGLAGPLIIAALAIAAVVGAILFYEKFETAARKLLDTQIALAEQFGRSNDKLLEQNETLIGLTQGPMAKYQAELNDLSQKQISVGISNITKELDDQKSKWDTLAAGIDRYLSALLELDESDKKRGATAPYTIDQAENFIKQEEKIRVASKDQFKALEDDLQATGAKLVALHNLEADLDGKNLEIIEKSRQGLQDYYKELSDDYQLYLAKRATLQAGANGQYLSEQRKAAQEELRAFNEQLSKLKGGEDVVSPQKTLALRQSQLSQFDKEHPGDQNQSSPYAQTRDTLVKDVGSAQQAIDRQNRSLDELIKKYQDEVSASGAYSVALRTEVAQRKAAAEIEKLAPDNTNKAFTIAEINAQIAAREKDALVAKEEIAIYNEFQGPLERYVAALAASNRLLQDHAISANDAAIADNKAARAKQDALNPLNEYVIGLEHEIALLGLYGNELAVATEVDKVRQGLQKQGRDLTVQESEALSSFLTKLQQQKEIQTQINALYVANAQQVARLITQQIALNLAHDKGIISDTQYKIAAVNLNVALADQAVLEGKNVTIQNQLVAGIGKYIASYQGLAKGISDAYGQAFTTIADGAANSLGRALAYGENLGKALENVARQAVSQLIAAFIKLGIQWLVTQAIGDSIGAAATLATVAQAQTVAAAWAPAAAFASLASFGANAAPASAAVTGTVALTEALSLVAGHSGGGYIQGPGNGTSDSILGRLSNGEFVVNSQATAQNRDLLESINNGATAVRSNGKSSSGAGAKMEVNVIHDGSTAVTVERTDDNRIRIIAQQEAKNAVAVHAPSLIANEMTNPNSRVSKAMGQNLVVKRRR